MLCLGCKACGLGALTFCVGVAAGMIFPIGLVAAIEAILIVFLGYCCLCKW